METGIIKKITGKNSATIKVLTINNCDACAGKSSCKLFKAGQNETELEVYYNEPELQEGDKVRIDINPQKRITASMILFLLPILLLISSYILVSKLTQMEGLSIFISISTLVLSILGISLFFKKTNFSSSFKPHVYKL